MIWKPIKSAPTEGWFLVRENVGLPHFVTHIVRTTPGANFERDDGRMFRRSIMHSWHPIPGDEPDPCKECERRRKQTRDRVARVRARKRNG